MKKLLPLLKNLFVKGSLSLSIVLTLIALFGTAYKSQAQIYYLTNDATSSGSSTVDGINRMDYNGANPTLLANSFTVSPGLMEIDLPNNRAFVYEAFSSSPPNGLNIKVVNLTTGAVTATIPITENTARCYSIKYDAINDYIYYVVADASPTAANASDALIKIRPDGTGKTVVIAGFSKNPTHLALNVANNKAYIYNQLAAEKSLLTISLSGGTVSQTITITAPAGNPYLVNGMDYDPATDYIYYLSSNNSGATNANDAIYKVHPDGTSSTLVASVPQSPTSFALDVNNNRAFVYDNVAPARTITSYDLTTGSATQIASLTSLTGSATVTALWVPKAAVLTTTASSSITAVSATVGGNITRSDATVTDRGIVYSSSNATPTVGGSGVTKASNGSGTGTFSGSISSLSPTTTYYARAYATSGAGTSYGTVTSFTTLSNDATLSAFSISAGALTPGFSSSTTSYTASVTGDVTSITVTPTRNQANAIIKVNNVTVASGNASAAINLAIGDNVITTVVTAQDGTTKTYTLTVSRTKLSQTITFNPLPAKNYGDADFAPGSTASSSLAVSYSSDNTSVATITGGGLIHIVGAGTANITATQAGNANYNAATSAVQTLTVGKATVTVTANAQTKNYGDNEPAFTYTATGVIGTDAPTGELTRSLPNTNKFIGTYAIEQGTLSYGDNYNVTYIGANLTINKRPITVLPVGKTKVYGDADPFLNQFIVKAGTIAPGDATGDQFGRAPGESVGTYLMTLGTKKFYGQVDGNYQDITSNYDVTVQQAYVTITAKPITVTANAQTKTYGDADPELTYTTTGLAFSDAFTGTLTRVAGEVVGDYAITQGTLALTSNYVLSYTGANLSIDKANLTYVATPTTRIYQTPNPAFTGSVTGFVNGDDQATATTGSLNFTTTATISSPVGSYPINGDGLSASNYNFVQAAENAVALSVISSNDATLSALTINSGTLTPSFSSSQENYSVSVAYAVSTLNVSAIVNQANASVTINGQAYTSGTTKDIALNTGTNNITIVVTAQDGVASKTYQLVVTRAMPAVNANYSAISLTPISTLIPTSLVSFKTSVTASQSSVKVTTTPQEQNATVTVNGVPVISRVESGSIPLNQSTTTITVVITAEDGVTSKTYTVIINRTGSSNTNLSSISLSPQSTLTHVSADNYSTSVSANQSSVAVKAVTQDAGATLTVNGVPATSGVASSSVALVGVSTLIPVVVTAADGSTVKTYTITVTRSGSSSTTVNNIAISPASQLVLTSFNNYTTSVAAGQTSVSVITTVQDANTNIKVNGTTTASGVASAPVTLTGPSTDITILITAQNGVTKTYTITVNRAGSNNATLSNINLTPASLLTLTSGNNYSTSVSAGQSSITITPIAQNENATIAVNGTTVASGSASDPIALQMGATVVNIVVTAQDGVTTKTYAITVNKTGSSDARINNIALTPATPLTQTSANNYLATVLNRQESITVTANVVDAAASIKINGVSAANGTASAPIALAVGSNIINVIATAEDGTTTKTYTVTVNRTASGESRLSNIIITPSSILTATSPYTFNTSVSTAQTSIIVSAVSVDPSATIKINGTLVNSGTQSGAISLNQGTTLVTILVTGADGVTTKTYVINVARTGSSDARVSGFALTPSSVLTQASPGNYITNVGGSQNSVRLAVNAVNVNSTITVQGVAVPSGIPSDEITLAGGATDILIQVVAEDGITTKNYKITVNKQLDFRSIAITKAGANMLSNKAGKTFEKDDVVVHKGLSPNGDGFNDFLVIEGLSSYTNSKLSVMNTSGTLVFDMKDYGKDGSRVFEGRAKNGTLLKAGTYYYTLDYKDGDKDKRKTGYIILKF